MGWQLSRKLVDICLYILHEHVSVSCVSYFDYLCFNILFPWCLAAQCLCSLCTLTPPSIRKSQPMHFTLWLEPVSGLCVPNTELEERAYETMRYGYCWIINQLFHSETFQSPSCSYIKKLFRESSIMTSYMEFWSILPQNCLREL